MNKDLKEDLELADITQEWLKENTFYDPDTGTFIWIKSPYHKSQLNGKEIGWITVGGYRLTKIRGKEYQCHRLIWMYMYGEWPKDEIDHINGVCDDNRIINLRDVPHSENGKNLKLSRRNKSGCTGVCKSNSGSWMAYIRAKGKHTHLGTFNNYRSAVCARKQAEKENGYHRNHGSCR